MSNKKLKPDANQLPLTKYVKANNNNNIVLQDDTEVKLISESPNSVCKKRKNPCKGISPSEKISPPPAKKPPHRIAPCQKRNTRKWKPDYILT